MLEPGYGKFAAVEILFIGPESQRGTGVALPDFADGLEWINLVASLERRQILFAAAADFNFELL